MDSVQRLVLQDIIPGVTSGYIPPRFIAGEGQATDKAARVELRSMVYLPMLRKEFGKHVSNPEHIVDTMTSSVRRAVAARDAFVTQAQAAGYRMDAVYRPPIRDYIIRRLADRKYQEKQVDTSIVSFSQSLCDEKGVGGLLQAPDLAVSDCPEMGESGLHPPPLLRDAEIVPENDHV